LLLKRAASFDHFVEVYATKYDKAVACLTKDRSALLAFYDFPAEHWKHLRSTHPIESTCATAIELSARRAACRKNRSRNGLGLFAQLQVANIRSIAHARR
jgi:putative transposase